MPRGGAHASSLRSRFARRASSARLWARRVDLRTCVIMANTSAIMDTAPFSDRALLARLAFELEKDGVPRATFRAALGRAGYRLEKRTLNHQIATFAATGSVFSTESDKAGKHAGRAPAWSAQQRQVAKGWVLTQISLGKIVSLESCASFGETHFGVRISLSTAFNLLHESGFSSRKMKKRGRGFTIDSEQCVALMLEWHATMRKAGLFALPRSHVHCIDFTYTSQRTSADRSFAPVGGAAPLSNREIPKFTNVIVTCASADGELHFKPILYTYNQCFRFDRRHTERRRSQLEELRSLIKKYELEEWQIQYCGEPANEKRAYVAESADIVSRFFSNQRVEKGWVALSDKGEKDLCFRANRFRSRMMHFHSHVRLSAGYALFPKDGSALKTAGFAEHYAFPPDVHHHLSVLDNGIFGPAKSAWKKFLHDCENDVQSSLYLLYAVQKFQKEQSSHAFSRNMYDLNADSAREIVTERSLKHSEESKECLRAYRVFVGEDARGSQDRVPPELRDRLDGPAMQPKRARRR